MRSPETAPDPHPNPDQDQQPDHRDQQPDHHEHSEHSGRRHRDRQRCRQRRLRRALLGTAVAGLALAAPATLNPAQAAPRPVDLQILSFNDYHGHLDPPTGSDGTLPSATGPLSAGGVEYLTTHLRTLRTGHRNTLTVADGDLIGGSPFLSGLFKDEPSIETLNALRVDVASVGNHEFDEGVAELLRMQYGGCHPSEGCFDADGYTGAAFPYLAANVAYRSGAAVTRPANARHYGRWFGERTGRTVLPPTWVKTVSGIEVGFIGVTLEGTDELVAQAGIKDVTFRDEIIAADLAARDLREDGVRAIVMLLHEGGMSPSGSTYDFSCGTGKGATISGPVVDIARRVDPGIDLIVTGHTHHAYVCDIPDPTGRSRQVTSAASYGRAVTETNLQLDPQTRDVLRGSVRSANRPVTRDVPPAADQSATIAKWKSLSDPLAGRVVGTITAPITRSTARNTESSLGDLIADAQLEATSGAGDGGSVIALMNPGGVRADLTYPGSAAGEGDGRVTYGEAFGVQPFGNLLVSMDLTGVQLEQVLEQQWTTQADGSVRFLHLGVSRGLSYAWSDSAPVGNKIDPTSILVNGAALDPAATYRVTVNSFLADGGDGFLELRNGTNRLGGGVDLDAFTGCLGRHSPVTGPTPDRVTRLP